MNVGLFLILTFTKLIVWVLAQLIVCPFFCIQLKNIRNMISHSVEAIQQAQEFKLNMIFLPFHTSHVLQWLDISYFKPFKTSFRKVKNKSYV